VPTPHPPVASGTSPLDLRTRNRDRNRKEVADVALALFLERGFDDVTVDEIAAAAGISRRTFFRYFDSKEGVVLPFEEERLEVLRGVLTRRPPGEPIFVGLRRALVSIVALETVAERAEMLARLRIIMEHPSLHARSLEQQSVMECAVREVIAEHLGVDPETDLAARVVAGTTMAAVRASVEVWHATGGREELATLIAQALDVLVGDLVPDRP
jgi:AcrR family transcriptional regulator